VLLIIDSITRFAHAARDVAMAAGELAVARGYAPSVFSANIPCKQMTCRRRSDSLR
jgi:flagellar biosynthesis/type III secretory pathway ATPase